MPRYRVVAMATAISVLAVAAAWAQPSGPPQYDPTAVPPPAPPPQAGPPAGPTPGAPQPGGLPAPLGPALSCADFVHNGDGTWSAAHPVPLHNGAASITLWPLAHFGAGAIYAGLDIAPMLDQTCGGS
jgi:hypothetical protein